MSNKIKIYFDDTCPMCTDSVKKIDNFFLKKNSELIPCSNNKKIIPDIKKYNSWIVEKNGVRKYGFDAFIFIISQTRFIWPLKYILNISLFNKIGNVIYSYISSTRSTKL